MEKMTIAIGSDHAGFAYKDKIKSSLKRQGYHVLDKGTFDETSVDYPDFARKVAEAVARGELFEALGAQAENGRRVGGDDVRRLAARLDRDDGCGRSHGL